MDVEMVTVVRAIEALPVVTVLSPLAASSKNKPGYRVGLRCFSCQEYGSCGQQQAGPVRITNTRTTLLACLQELHKQIVDDHGARCVDATPAADESATSSSSTADACLAGAASNVMDLMMRFSNTKARAVAANKVALEAEQAKDALEREVQALERVMKRPRTEASSTKNAEGHESGRRHVGTWATTGGGQRVCGTSTTLCSALLKKHQRSKELPKVKPYKWGCVQASQFWYVHMCASFPVLVCTHVHMKKKEKKRTREQERKSERERETEKV